MKSRLVSGLLALSLYALVPAAAVARPGGGGAARPDGFTRPVGATPAVRPAAAGTTRTLSPTQQANVQKLQSDLSSIKAGSTVTPEQKAAVKNSLLAVADGATKPSEESVAALSGSLSTALADGNLTAKEKAQISRNAVAVLSSANIPPSEVEALVTSTQSLLQSSGVSAQDAQTVANDLRAIGAEVKQNATAAAGKAATMRSKPAGTTTP